MGPLGWDEQVDWNRNRVSVAMHCMKGAAGSGSANEGVLTIGNNRSGWYNMKAINRPPSMWNRYSLLTSLNQCKFYKAFFSNKYARDHAQNRKNNAAKRFKEEKTCSDSRGPPNNFEGSSSRESTMFYPLFCGINPCNTRGVPIGFRSLLLLPCTPIHKKIKTQQKGFRKAFADGKRSTCSNVTIIH